MTEKKSPICFEFFHPYGICYWCDKQAEPVLSFHLGDEPLDQVGNKNKTEIEWCCKWCGKRWPIQHLDLCAVLIASQWTVEVHKNGLVTPSRRWYPTHTNDGPEGEPFTEELREKARQDFVLTKVLKGEKPCKRCGHYKLSKKGPTLGDWCNCNTYEPKL